MRTPFKTEDALGERYSTLSELAKFEYHRRLDEARYVGLAAYVARQAATNAELTLMAKMKAGKRSELIALGLACVLGIIGFALNSDFARNSVLVILAAWAALAILRNEVVAPALERQKASGLSNFQVLSRRWYCIVGPGSLSDYLQVLEAEYVGGEIEEAEAVYLHIRGTILVTVDNLQYQP